MKHIHVTVFGDDPRLEPLSKELSRLGYQTEHFSSSSTDQTGTPSNSDCLVFPLFPPIKMLARAMDYGNSNACICAGLPSKEFILMANEHGFSVYDYMADPHVTIQNAIATAEGALAEAIRMSPYTLQNNHVLIIGFGRCGEMLAIKCRALGAHVTVCECQPLVLSHAQAHGFDVTAELESCDSYSFIFNTAPCLTLNASLLATVQKDIAIIDLATSPGGTDFSFCKQAGITAKLCPSLPAIYAPKTSGIILAHAIHHRLAKLQFS